MIDLHSHLLPGIDDGSRSIQQSIQTLRHLIGAGVTDLAVTPHLRAVDIGTRGEDSIERRDLLLEELRAQAPEGIRLHAGFEIMLDGPLPDYALADRRYALAGSQYYLVEFPTSVGPTPATAALAALRQAGVTPVVAHPERYHVCTVRDFTSWVGIGCALQVDATTVTRPTSRGTMARRVIEAGLAHVLAADNHGDRRSLATGRRYLEDKGAGEAAHWLTTENPRAILEDQPLARVPPLKLKLGLGERVRGWLRDVR